MKIECESISKVAMTAYIFQQTMCIIQVNNPAIESPAPAMMAIAILGIRSSLEIKWLTFRSSKLKIESK